MFNLGLVGEASWVLPLAVAALLAGVGLLAAAGWGKRHRTARTRATAVTFNSLGQVDLVVQACDGAVERGGLLDDGDLALPHT